MTKSTKAPVKASVKAPVNAPVNAAEYNTTETATPIAATVKAPVKAPATPATVKAPVLKATAWTPELVELATSQYLAGIEEGLENNTIIDNMLKMQEFKALNVPKLRGKLSSEKVYIAAKGKGKPATVAGATTKADTVKALENVLSLPSGSLVSFDKATVSDLNTLFNAIVALGSDPVHGSQDVTQAAAAE